MRLKEGVVKKGGRNQMPCNGVVSILNERGKKRKHGNQNKIVIQRGELVHPIKCSFLLLSIRIDAVNLDHRRRFGEVSCNNDGNSH